VKNKDVISTSAREEKSFAKPEEDFYPASTMSLLLACACGKVQAK
jgi:hypothetical protein